MAEGKATDDAAVMERAAMDKKVMDAVAVKKARVTHQWRRG
jgi:hypothetical protein